MPTNMPRRLTSLSVAITVISASALHAQAPSSTIMPANTISLTSFSPDSFFLNNFIFPVNLRHTVAGLTPSHYRFSRFADFRDAQWIAYEPTPRITTQREWFTPDAGSNGSRFSAPLFFQLRARNPNAGRPVSIAGPGLTKPGSEPEKTGTVTVQPDFFNSNTRNRTLRVVFAS